MPPAGHRGGRVAARRGYDRLDVTAMRRQTKSRTWTASRAQITSDARSSATSRGPGVVATIQTAATMPMTIGAMSNRPRPRRPLARWPSPGISASRKAGPYRGGRSAGGCRDWLSVGRGRTRRDGRRPLSIHARSLADGSMRYHRRRSTGEWPSGKAPDSGSGDRRFESFLASHSNVSVNAPNQRVHRAIPLRRAHGSRSDEPVP